MKLLSSALLVSSLLAASAHAGIVIFDDFNRSGPLAGSSTSGPGGSWVGGAANYTTTGTLLNIASSGGGGGSYQSISLLTNTTYTLSADLRNNTAGSVDWIGFGFGTNSGQVGSGDAVLLEGTGKAYAYEVGSNQGVGYASDIGLAKGSFSIVLTTGNTLGASHVEYFRNGTSFGAYHSTNASLFTRAFVQDSATVAGSIDNFTLTATAVPEPSSLLLLSIAGLGLVRRRR